MTPRKLSLDHAVAADPQEDALRMPVLQGRLVHVKGQDVLFSPAQRAIFTLNATAADIWRALKCGLTPAAIASEIARRGTDAPEANELVEAALGEWLQLGLVRPSLGPTIGPRRGAVTRTVAVHNVRARIDYPAAVAVPSAEVFRHLEVGSQPADVVLQFVEYGGAVHLFRDGEWMQLCASDEIAPVLKAQLLTEVLERDGYELALHSASLGRGERNLLLCGNPGAGKTTLTLALVHAGFDFAGDDVTLLFANGLSMGLPFAPAVKAGAWPVLSEFLPDLSAVPIFRRPDRRRVRYPVPKGLLPSVPRPVGWVVLLDRRAKGGARMAQVEPSTALTSLMNGSFSVDEELTDAAFDVLVRIIASAPVYSLTYSRLEDAVKLLSDTCL